jgi:sulfatase modifying factor 1
MYAHSQNFEMDETSVTNQEFREFVKETKFKTEAETFGWSFVLDYLLTDAARAANTQALPDAKHWIAVDRAWWRYV